MNAGTHVATHGTPSVRERSIRERLLDALESQHPKSVGAEKLCALAGVRRMLLATAMSELIVGGEAYLASADVYALGRRGLVPVSLDDEPAAIVTKAPARANGLTVALTTPRLAVEKKPCKRCDALKALTEFYKCKGYKDGRDTVCKACRSKDRDDQNAERKVRREARLTKLSAAESVGIAASGAPRCKCGGVCEYYGAMGGYSVQCEACNASRAQARHTVVVAESIAESKAAAIVEPSSSPIETPLITPEKPALTFNIPPRPGLNGWVEGDVAIIRQGNSQIEIHIDDAEALMGWLSMFWLDEPL